MDFLIFRRSTPNPDLWELVSWARAYSGYTCYGFYRNKATGRVFRGAAWGAHFETQMRGSANCQ